MTNRITPTHLTLNILFSVACTRFSSSIHAKGRQSYLVTSCYFILLGSKSTNNDFK